MYKIRLSKIVYGVNWTKLDTGGTEMGDRTTPAITRVKQEVKLREWAEQIKAQQESGMTVTAFCAENGINLKTYYYRLRKVREQCMGAAPAIVPVTIPKQSLDIRIEKNGLQISLPADISAETLIALVRELC